MTRTTKAAPAAETPATPEAPGNPFEDETPEKVDADVAEDAKPAEAKALTRKVKFTQVPNEKLPLAAYEGDLVGTIKHYAGQPVVEFSLAGFIGTPEFSFPADQIYDLEKIIKNLRKQAADSIPE